MSKLPKLSFSMPELGGIAIPAMAVGGLVGVMGVLIGLQCGGLDKCFFPVAGNSAAVVAPTEPAVAEIVTEPRLVADPVVVAEAPAEPVPDARTVQIDRVIGGSFAAISANDEGWLQSARAGTAVPDPAPVEEGDGAGPIEVAAVAPGPSTTTTARTGTGQTAAEAVASVLAEPPVVPLDRPEPLEISAYAETPRTPAAVSAAAGEKLEEVAAAVEPEPEPEPDPVEVAAVEEPVSASGDVRTVGGAGVNVRSGPGKSNGTLFTLAAGKEVTVLDNERGWLKVTDDRNRTGWLYQTFVN